MSRPKFRLATLLKLRESVRDQRRTRLAEALRAEQVIVGRRASVAAELDALMRECREAAQPGEVDLDRLLVARRYEAALRVEDRDLAKKHEALRGEIDRRRDALVEANRSVRVLELLREKQQRDHLEKEARLEIKQLDEVGQRCGAGEGER